MAGLTSVPSTPRTGRNLVIDRYYQHYFSGDQARIYLDGIYVSDINYIEYSIASNKAPIYSYNDPYYKVVARGNYLVQGNFNINFTERNKIIKIKDELVRKRRVTSYNTVDFKALRTDKAINRFFNVATDIDKDAVLRKFENAYWGTPKDSGPLRYIRPDEWDLVDGDIDPDGLDIVMVIGVPGGAPNLYAVKQLNDVHITGESMVINSDGNPLIEQYSFFARKIDGEKTTYYPQEEKLEPKEELRPGRDLHNWEVSVYSEAHITNRDVGDFWTAIFYFDTGDRSVRITNIEPDRIVYGNTSITDVRTEGSLSFTEDKHSESARIYMLYDIPWSDEYVELRSPTCFLEAQEEPEPLYQTDNIKFHRPGPIRQFRPSRNDELPPKITN